METRYYFKRTDEDDLITATADFKLGTVTGKTTLIIDTGATHTVFDLNVLLLHDFNPFGKEASELIPVRTASGRIDAIKTNLTALSCLGLVQMNFPILAYDFLLCGMSEPYGGMLGLDFLKEAQLYLNMNQSYIQMLTQEQNRLLHNLLERMNVK